MDFRGLDRMGDSDESILDEPYRPFYNIFASKPVLVKQYVALLSVVDWTNEILETTTTMEQPSRKDLYLECYCLTTLRLRHEILLPMREVCTCFSGRCRP